ncbi:hypothetical protein MRX96_000927 [Rhipicephalus microplus]
MTGPVVDAAEVHSLLAHYNLSVEVFESAARDVIIEHLVWLAAHGDLVPALRIHRNVATPDSQSSCIGHYDSVRNRRQRHSIASIQDVDYQNLSSDAEVLFVLAVVVFTGAGIFIEVFTAGS